MDDNKRAFISMCEKVDNWLQLKATDLAATAADVATLQSDIHAKIDEALANDTQANLDNTGQTAAKNDERAELTESTRRVIPYLVKYFLSVPDRRMADRINYNKSELESADDNKFYENSKLVYDTAHVSGTLTAIIALGYTNTLHTEHNTNLGEFRDLIGTPRMLTGDASSYNRAVDRNITELRALLDSTDIEINLIEFDQPILFDAYYAVRKIDDAAGGGSSIYSGSVNSGETKQVTTITYDAALNLKIENTGAVPLQFILFLGGSQAGTLLTVTAGNTENHPITDLYTDGDALMVRNPDASPGSYSVTIS